jgi:cytochrome c553
MRLLIWGFLITAPAFAQQYTPKGELMLPKDYREWIFLSSGIGMTYSDGSSPHPDFDNVFVNPAAYKAFLATGTWPDKTVLLIENRTSEDDPASKNGKFQTKVSGFEAHVKDASHGGWSFYFIRAGAQSGAAFPKTANCYTCHEKNGATDTTFVQYYPTLIDTAVKKGTFRKDAH